MRQEVEKEGTKGYTALDSSERMFVPEFQLTEARFLRSRVEMR
jgi:hypothetical protein